MAVRTYEDKGRVGLKESRVLQREDRFHSIRSMFAASLLQKLECPVNMSALALNVAAAEGSDVDPQLRLDPGLLFTRYRLNS